MEPLKTQPPTWFFSHFASLHNPTAFGYKQNALPGESDTY